MWRCMLSHTCSNELNMKQFFFDLRGATNSYDYRGCYLRSSHEARDMAEMMALDLGCSETENWIGSNINVVDVAGTTLFSIPVLSPTGWSAAA
jgi:hypothetical protein